MTNIKTTEEQQKEILKFMSEEYELNLKDLEKYFEQIGRVYQTTSLFGKSSDMYINFANNVLNLFVAKVMTRPPKATIKVKKTNFFEWEERLEGLQRDEAKERNEVFAKAVQDYLETTLKNIKAKKLIKRVVRSLWAYGRWYSSISTGYDVERTRKTEGGIQVKIKNKYPKIEQISIWDVVFNPNYKDFDDLPGYFIKKSGVRLRDLELAKNSAGAEKYFNLNKVKELSNLKLSDPWAFRKKIEELTGTTGKAENIGLDKNALDLVIYEGLYSLTGKASDEAFYEITTVANILIIGIEQKTTKNVKAIDCFEDLELGTPSGIIAPIIWLQEEINFQKEAKRKLARRAINGTRLWDPMSGINPNDLLEDKPIIMAKNGIDKAVNGVHTMDYPQLPVHYFSDINDMQRDFQKLTYTVDVTQQWGQTALTNTATGAKISFYEWNTVIADIRENIKEFYTDLCYQILNWAYENIDDKVDIKNLEWEELEINKEVFKDAIDRYEISIEAGTMGLDTQAERRENAIAVKNIMLEAGQAGIPIDFVKAYTQLFDTFDGINADDFIKKQDNIALMQWWEQSSNSPLSVSFPPGEKESESNISLPKWQNMEVEKQGAEELTNRVASGGIEIRQ